MSSPMATRDSSISARISFFQRAKHADFCGTAKTAAAERQGDVHNGNSYEGWGVRVTENKESLPTEDGHDVTAE
jgi:hypothetical protein